MKGNNMTDIVYRGFWDVPRIFLARVGGDVYLFDCPFSETLDDYPDVYEVFLLSPSVDWDDLPKDWTTLSKTAVRRLGTIPVADVRFDPTLRKQFDASILDTLTAAPARASG
jgi:hypothetical protein